LDHPVYQIIITVAQEGSTANARVIQCEADGSSAGAYRQDFCLVG